MEFPDNNQEYTDNEDDMSIEEDEEQSDESQEAEESESESESEEEAEETGSSSEEENPNSQESSDGNELDGLDGQERIEELSKTFEKQYISILHDSDFVFESILETEETLQELDCEYEIFDMIDDYNTTLIHDAEQAVLKKILEEFIPEFNQRQQDQKKTVPTRRKRIKKNN